MRSYGNTAVAGKGRRQKDVRRKEVACITSHLPKRTNIQVWLVHLQIQKLCVKAALSNYPFLPLESDGTRGGLIVILPDPDDRHS
jgi:hypothetical protein